MQPSPDAEAAATLEQAIEKAKEVAADIRQAADDLAVANTVLGTQLAEDVRTGEVAQALEHGESVEKTLTKSAEVLNQVNASLDSVSATAAKS
ncbi:hypothetical protein [Pseudorhodoferax sp. Leaf267]|uniref:hypothetical protein n=1 Tax=Pseudorhodoferax sp. Leaf267 TaxID=1736316 RepID=UPI0006F6E3E5|nr:hypothetical protein [Pseudorhodoferax sp. Leaf267]KQP21514.1 hypothetical protein ASF43_26475 [Pseudorhodoferax sp. Leaf267]